MHNTETDAATGLTVLKVNPARWDGPQVPDGWLIVNAPRPLLGQQTWTGEFRHGTFYAASPEVHGGTFGWKSDDAYLVRWITNAEIEALVLAKFAEYGYGSAEEAGVTIAEQAYCMQLPYALPDKCSHRCMRGAHCGGCGCTGCGYTRPTPLG